MNQSLYKKPRGFSTRRVSADQAVRLLGRNGICVDKEKAEAILDFLYLISKTYKVQRENDDRRELEPKE